MKLYVCQDHVRNPDKWNISQGFITTWPVRWYTARTHVTSRKSLSHAMVSWWQIRKHTRTHVHVHMYARTRTHARTHTLCLLVHHVAYAARVHFSVYKMSTDPIFRPIPLDRCHGLNQSATRIGGMCTTVNPDTLPAGNGQNWDFGEGDGHLHGIWAILSPCNRPCTHQKTWSTQPSSSFPL